MLDLLKLQHEAENLTVTSHYIFSENRRQWSQIRHSVVKKESLPTSIIQLSRQELHVKSTYELLWMELSVARPYCIIKMDSHVVFV